MIYNIKKNNLIFFFKKIKNKLKKNKKKKNIKKYNQNNTKKYNLKKCSTTHIVQQKQQCVSVRQQI